MEKVKTLKKNNILKKISFYEYYIFYCFCYILLYIHSTKWKVIKIIGIIENTNQDHIVYIIFVCFCFFMGVNAFYLKFHNSKNKILYNFARKGKQILYAILSILLIFYIFSNLQFVNNFFYIWESLFFALFGFLALLVPLLLRNQLFFLIGLFLFFILHNIFIYVKKGNCIILGYLATLSLKKWLYIFLLLIAYILSSVLLDMFKHHVLLKKKLKNNLQQSNVDENSESNRGKEMVKSINSEEFSINNRKEKISFESIEKITFTAEIMDSIYNTKNNMIIANETSNIDELGEKLVKVLKIFSIFGEMYKQLIGYTVTNYFFKPQIGTKMSRIESIEEELSMEIGRNVRVSSNLQGVVFEVVNEKNFTFSFKDVWEENRTEELPLLIGFDTLGKKVILDLTKQPHILMCGTTGSGKSSTLQCLIHSLITTKSLNSFQFLFIDPKVLELSIYKSLPNLVCSIITNLDEAAKALGNLVSEMEKRYKIISQANQRSIKEYNLKSENKLPYLVCVIEEFADLALHKNHNFKNSVQRLAQMGRAAGIHLIIATQRPSVNVIDGVIKANFPARIGLKVANKMESRIILDQSGAERMSGPGEMILLDGSGLIRRVVSPYISEEEMEKLMNYINSF